MCEQLLCGLPVGLQRYVRLVARRKIIAPEWKWGLNTKLLGHREVHGLWRVWPRGHEEAWLSGLPGRFVRRDCAKRRARAGAGGDRK